MKLAFETDRQCSISPTLPPPKMLTGSPLMVMYKNIFRRYATSRGRMAFKKIP